MKKQVKRRSAASPRAIQASRLWRLSHRRHSGRILPRSNTSYPTLIMIVLCMGVFLMGWTRVVTAVDSGTYGVSGRVVGQAPTVPATINQPIDGTEVATKPLNVSGTCPVSTYVQLFRNNFPSGIALCSSGGNYTISTDLFVGSNELIARVYSFSDTPGPDSLATTIVYNPTNPLTPAVSNAENPTSPSSGPGQSVNADSEEDREITEEIVNAETRSPIRLTSDFTYYGYEIGKKVEWTLNISGGKSPYAVSVDWGDGKSDLHTKKEDGKLDISHRYKKSGNYTIKIKIIDDIGARSFLQLIAVVDDSNSGIGFTGGGIKSLPPGAVEMSTLDSLSQLVKYAWPTYGVVLLMLFSFWLGETREFTNLKKTSHKKRSR